MTINMKSFNSLPNDNFLDRPNLKEFANNNFKFDDNGIKALKKKKKKVVKGELAHYEQLLLFPQRFQKTCTADT